MPFPTVHLAIDADAGFAKIFSGYPFIQYPLTLDGLEIENFEGVGVEPLFWELALVSVNFEFFTQIVQPSPHPSVGVIICGPCGCIRKHRKMHFTESCTICTANK